MKSDRQALILEIVAAEPIDTQELLLARLRERGVQSTQATISRDIKELHLVKEPAGRGAYRYAVSGAQPGVDVAEKLRTIFRESVVSVDRAQNIVVLRTMPGTANAACSALDHMKAPGVVGSLAGDDTAFLAMRDTESAETLCRKIREML